MMKDHSFSLFRRTARSQNSSTTDNYHRVKNFFQRQDVEQLSLIIILLLASFVRLYHMDKNMNLDEIGQVLVSQNGLKRAILDASTHAAATPLDYVVTSLSLFLGKSAGVLRLPVVLWSILTLYCLYFLGRQLYGKPAGLVATILLALTPVHITYSHIIRFYSLTTFLTILLIYTFYKVVSEPSLFRWLIFAVIHLLALYSHYYLLIVTAVLGLWLFLGFIKKQITKSLLIQFILVAGMNCILFLPWVYYDIFVYGKGSPETFSVLRPVSLSAIPEILKFIQNNVLALLGSPIGNAELLRRANWGSLWLYSIWGLFLLGSLFSIRRLKEQYFSLLISLIPIIIIPVILILDYWAYAFNARQILFILPLVFLVASKALIQSVVWIEDQISSKINIRPAAYLLSPLLIIGFLLVSFRAVLPHVKIGFREGERYFELSLWLRYQVHEKDIIVTDDPRYLMLYAPELNAQTYPFWQRDLYKESTVASILSDLSSKHDRVWIIPTFPLFQGILEAWQKQTAPINYGIYSDFNTDVFIYSTRIEEKELVGELFNSDPLGPIEHLLKSNKPKEAYELASQMLTSKSMSEKSKHIARVQGGRLFSDYGQSDLSVQLMALGTSDSPTRQAEALANIGFVSSQKGDIEGAIKAYKQALELNPKHYWAAHLLAQIYASKQMWDEVIELEENAVFHAPDASLMSSSLNALERAYAKSSSPKNLCDIIVILLETNNHEALREKADFWAARNKLLSTPPFPHLPTLRLEKDVDFA